MYWRSWDSGLLSPGPCSLLTLVLCRARSCHSLFCASVHGVQGPEAQACLGCLTLGCYLDHSILEVHSRCRILESHGMFEFGMESEFLGNTRVL